MIITGKKEIPRSWTFLAILPWTSQYLEGMAMGAAFFFSLYKFIDNPAGLTFILSLPPFIGLVMGPLTHFLSDRIWTRCGRRKPFIITSWCGTLTAMAVMPLMPTFVTLLAAYMVFIFFNTMGGPVETLEQEIVPPKQRVSTAAIQTWMRQFVMLVFYLIAIGRFDDEGYLAGLPVSGEESIYWAASMSSLVMILLIMLGMKEIDPKSSLTGRRLGLKDFFTSVLAKNIRVVYVLVFGAAVYSVGAGAIGSLLYIEQWQFTKQELGTNVAVGGALNLVIIFVLGLFAKKLPRMKTYQALLVIGMVLNVCFYFYVNFFIYNQKPTLIEVIIFGEMLAIVGTLKAMIYAPLVYDYIPRNEMGTYAAGASIINRLVNILLLNGAGLFVIFYSKIFLPQGGEMVTISVPDMIHEDQVAEVVRDFTWYEMGTETTYDADRVFALAWYGNGAALNEGRAFELVFRNEDSEDLFERRKDLNKKNNPLKAKAGNARALANIAEREGDPAEARELRASAEEYDTERAPLQEEIDTITAELDARSEHIKQQVLDKLDPILLQDGQQIIAATEVPAFKLDWLLKGPPGSRRIEKGLDRLRDAYPGVIDIRARKEGEDYLLRLSAEMPEGRTADQAAAELSKQMELIFSDELESVWISGQTPQPSEATAVNLQLRIAEDPLDQHLSPIMTGVYWLMDIVAEPPKPERRVYGFARNLRSAEVARHIRVLPGEDHSIHVTALRTALLTGRAFGVSENSAEKDDDETSIITEGIQTRLAEMLDNSDTQELAALLYGRVVELGSSNDLNVTRPYIDHRFSERQYDYMSSYIWMLILDVIGIIITINFVRREKRGEITKRGVAEMEATS